MQKQQQQIKTTQRTLQSQTPHGLRDFLLAAQMHNSHTINLSRARQSHFTKSNSVSAIARPIIVCRHAQRANVLEMEQTIGQRKFTGMTDANWQPVFAVRSLIGY